MTIKIVDLHIHSFYSDGTMSPAEILETAYNKNLGVISITDHDVIDGSLKLMELSNNYNIKCIPGVEIDALENGVNYHILAYGVDLEDKDFIAFILKNRDLLEEVNIKLIEKMQKDYDFITVSDYLDFNYDKRMGGWKALHYFIEKGITNSLVEGFMIYTKYKHSYNCVQFLSIKQVCDIIHHAGGKAVLAHPGKVIKSNNLNEFKIKVLEIIDFGLDGIECYYPSHTAEITNICVDICKSKDLLITCGSDCHGKFQSTEIGEMDITLENLKLDTII
ncbi:PHP domain-containing protein [Anaerocolumna sedimenticola]|uniref:PHP domain-containing protein n=1 Tax=Anaerocolumna sedimenticola TaxID=2696063 RepID=A0A6P1TRT0_9FIRM|nr:PHP domain-containing protein [Anaerocolumna sedimenticola]QHQ62952.1 PHP domain-containing protein [Anaerocolumna sedimenticola]